MNALFKQILAPVTPKQSSHTPGPFFIGAQSTEAGEPIVLICANARDGENKTIARMVGPDAQGNARRFAAAPDAIPLFEDLQEYLCEHGGAATELLERIDAWLAKATGGLK